VGETLPRFEGGGSLDREGEGDLEGTGALKPRDEPEERRLEIIFSRPTKAPAKTKRMLEVSMVYCSFLPVAEEGALSLPSGLVLELRSALAFTVTVVPSIIFRRPCCTPSPETSRPWVITGGFASLSTSSKKIMPVSHLVIEWEEASRSRSMEDSMSVPM